MYSKKNTISADAWLTPGLRNACKKKNKLYKLFLKERTQIAEKRYKLYKNNLTSILRCSQKDNYRPLLTSQKGDIKATWTILNSVIKRGKCSSEYPKEFKMNNKLISDQKTISTGFKFFFVNVGNGLAKKIPNCNDCYFADCMPSPLSNSMFLSTIAECEILEIVNIFNNKTSCGYDGINMRLVKKSLIIL